MLYAFFAGIRGLAALGFVIVLVRAAPSTLTLAEAVVKRI
jgi:hypothetical protein